MTIRKFVVSPLTLFDRAAFGIFAFGCFLLGAVEARADSLSDLSKNMQTMFKDFAPALKIGFGLGGFFLIGIGLWQLYQKSQRPGEPKGGALVAILIGGALLGAAAIAQMTTSSLGTQGSSSFSSLGLGG